MQSNCISAYFNYSDLTKCHITATVHAPLVNASTSSANYLKGLSDTNHKGERRPFFSCLLPNLFFHAETSSVDIYVVSFTAKEERKIEHNSVGVFVKRNTYLAQQDLIGFIHCDVIFSERVYHTRFPLKIIRKQPKVA